MDVKAFRKAKFAERHNDVPMPGLTAGGFGAGEDPGEVTFKVRGLTAAELARADQEADTSEVLSKIAERLSGSNTEKAEALMDGLGLNENTPAILARKLTHVQMGVVSPELKIQDVVKLADAYPTDFLELSNEIYNLTGKGKVAQVKPRPSGSKAISKPA